MIQGETTVSQKTNSKNLSLGKAGPVSGAFSPFTESLREEPSAPQLPKVLVPSPPSELLQNVQVNLVSIPVAVPYQKKTEANFCEFEVDSNVAQHDQSFNEEEIFETRSVQSTSNVEVECGPLTDAGNYDSSSSLQDLSVDHGEGR